MVVINFLQKRGIFFAIDALIAASIIMLGLILSSSFYMSEKTSTSINYLSSDMVRVLSSMKVYELNNSYVNQLIADGNISERVLNISIAEFIGEMWAENNTWIAFNLSQEFIEPYIDERFGYGLYINSKEISTRPKSVESSSVSSQKMISGIAKDKAIFGYSSRVYLSSIKDRKTSSFAYFGGFEGEGNLIKRLLLPDNFNITSAYLELEPGTDFRFYVNDNLCGEFPMGSGNGSYMVPDRWDINFSICNTSYFVSGVNNISIRFEYINENITAEGPKYIAGGYLRVTYISDNMDELDITYDGDNNAIKRYYFPGIDGFINLYSSFYVPGNLSQMIINLSFFSNYSIYLALGNTTIYEENPFGNRSLILNNDNISETLYNNSVNYSDLSLSTIPLRFAIKNVSLLKVPFDVALVTDISKSMDWRIDSDAIGVKRECDDPLLNDPSTRRITAAQCAGKALIDDVLSFPETLVGLIGYETVTQNIFNLNDDAVALKDELDSYVVNGGTCPCCGVRSAIDILMVDRIKTIISRKTSGWKYNDKDIASPPVGWTDLSFDDSSWKSKSTVFRNRYNWLGNPSTILDKYEGDYYFRKKFNIANISAINHSRVYILSDDGADIYLNGELIDNDYGSSHSARYWNRDRIDINKSLFVEGENIIAARLYNKEECFLIWCWPTDVAFDLELVISESEINQTKLKAMIVMTDGEANYACDGFYNITKAKEEAIDAACDAYNDFGIKVFTVGFGYSADSETLIAMANCSDGQYFNSTSVEELVETYKIISRQIMEYSSTQSINYSDLISSHLYPESYIEFNYTPIVSPPEYGKIPMTIEGPVFGNNISERLLYIPPDSELIELTATSYSADRWTSYVNVSNSGGHFEVFNLSSYNTFFHELGDAYKVNIPVNIIRSGENNTINVMTSTAQGNNTGGSSYNRLIYTARLDSLIDFSGVFSENEGCNWTLFFEDSTNSSVLVPPLYNGTKSCDYLNAVYDTDDATDEAAYRLFQKLDFDSDGYIDVRLDESNLLLDTLSVSDVPSMWGPAILEVRVWQ